MRSRSFSSFCCFSSFSCFRRACWRSTKSKTISSFPCFFGFFAFCTIICAPHFEQYAVSRFGSSFKFPLHSGQIAEMNLICFLNIPIYVYSSFKFLIIRRVNFAKNKKMRSASEAHQKTLLLRCYTSAQTKGERIRFFAKSSIPPCRAY